MVKLNNQSKQQCFDSSNSFLVSNHFWKSCKPYFSSKLSFGDSKIALNKNSKILTENIKIEKHFIRALNQLQILLNYSTGPFNQISPMTKCKILLSFCNHPSIIKIKRKSTVLYNLISFKEYVYVQWFNVSKYSYYKIRPFFIFIEGFDLRYGHVSWLISWR